MRSSQQLSLLDQNGPDDIAHARRISRTGTFVDNLSLPIHRWFRYSAGFSAEWVSTVVESRQEKNRQLKVLDPFAGTATTLLAAVRRGAWAIGIENHPFVARIGRAKLALGVSGSSLRARANDLVAHARRISAGTGNQDFPELLQRCYSHSALCALEGLRLAWLEYESSRDGESELLWLAITAILRPCSGVATAQWQYVLPNKKKARVLEPLSAFRAKVDQIAIDLHNFNIGIRDNGGSAQMIDGDARDRTAYANVEYDLVVTSPPYPNNFDYADATRVEMTFWREVKSWGDLHGVVRHRLVRSCSQHTAADRSDLDELLGSPMLAPIEAHIADVCRTLAAVRHNRGGKKTYHTMIAAYFIDLGSVLVNLAAARRPGAEVCMVIGDSAPYGVYVPVDSWVTALALAAGFTTSRFEKLRDRNVKWKNRKHRVPLQEGTLWLA